LRETVSPAITDSHNAAYVLTNDRSTLPNAIYITEGEPTFRDAANGDYHLTLTSLGVDSAPAASDPNSPKLDFDGKPRVHDEASIPNQFGPMDLGAYELQPSCGQADTVYCNGFEFQ